MANKSRGSRLRAVLCIMLCLVFITGCGRSLVITTGFRRGEVFRLGNEKCMIAQVSVYLLDLQKQNEKLYGSAVWESSDKEALQQSVKEQALSQITRVKALKRIAVSRNVMLSNDEKLLAEQFERSYYDGLSEDEKKYIGLDEKGLLKAVNEYVLADKVYRSLGENAEKVYEEFFDKTQCDLNTKYWQKVKLKKVEGNIEAPGLWECYQTYFGEERVKEAEEAGETGTTEKTEEK